MPGGRTSHSVLPPAEMGTAQHNAIMLYFVTTSDVYCDDYAPEYTTKFFRTRDVFEAYIVSLDEDEVYESGVLTPEQQEFYEQLVPF